MTKYILEQAWCIPTPAGTPYNLWWPWLKNYHGENSVGFNDYYGWSRYVWIDGQLKKSMGH
jgi:peptide/nickel transport system substrate-binding protein